MTKEEKDQCDHSRYHRGVAGFLYCVDCGKLYEDEQTPTKEEELNIWRVEEMRKDKAATKKYRDNWLKSDNRPKAKCHPEKPHRARGPR